MITDASCSDENGFGYSKGTKSPWLEEIDIDGLEEIDIDGSTDKDPSESKNFGEVEEATPEPDIEPVTDGCK